MSAATKKTAGKTSELFQSYAKKTSRLVHPFGKLAGQFVAPGAVEAVAKTMEHFADFLDNPSRMKTKIASKLRELDLRFVVLIDDLDRLEPVQAAETLRLVKSVADFANVVYIICYDREVLANALEIGLGVEDGDLYLQKIVQLSFTIPLPEPNSLRSIFLQEAVSIYEEAVGKPLDTLALDDLKFAADIEGGRLSTPREVELALNGVRFMFPSVFAHVYYPDVCRLQIIKTTNRKLYNWIEEYLSSYSVMLNGASVVKNDKRQMGRSLRKMLKSPGFDGLDSIYALGPFLPGLQRHGKPKDLVYNQRSLKEIKASRSGKRLASPFHYNYYFALTPPDDVMSVDQFTAVLELAESDVEQLSQLLLSYSEKQEYLGKSRLEHFLGHLFVSSSEEFNQTKIESLIIAICNVMEKEMTTERLEMWPSDDSLEAVATFRVRSLFVKLHELDKNAFKKLLLKLAKDNNPNQWLVGYFFRKIFSDNDNTSGAVFSADILEEVRKILRPRLMSSKVEFSYSEMPALRPFLLGWEAVSGPEEPNDWVLKVCRKDEGFLAVLMSLRSWSMSDKLRRPLSKKSIKTYFNYDVTIDRLKALKKSEHKEMVQLLQDAISLSGK